ncbi:hypothetical protein MW887_010754 [Aspergillus wentii]|nr:hypothetical protein MW887_010754 [Aspergillus wentii]
MPSGPPTLPFIGNIHQIPKSYTHLQFTKWARTYGPLYTLKIGPSTMAVITSRRLVKEVIDRKSSIYSDRSASYIAQNLITKGDHMLVMQYGAQWRMMRRLAHHHFMESMVHETQLDIVNAEAVQLVRDFLVDAHDEGGYGHMEYPKRYSHSIASSILFGIRTANHHGSNMSRLYKMLEGFTEILETGATPPIDIYPWLKYIPERLFGNYVTRARAVGTQMETLHGEILQTILKRRGESPEKNLGSFMDKVLDAQDRNQLPLRQVAFIGGVLSEGGSDTTSTLIITIIQALILNPDVQKKAQAEIDAVVGFDRSPVWADMKQLPYLNMIVKEGHRWRAILPLCFPHALSQDDWIDGQFLSKGTTIIINTWGIHMDPSQHPEYNPESFIPERYADHPLLASEYVGGKWENRDHYGYGVSRRICPGIHLAERNLLLAVTKLLWAFDFLPDERKTIDTDLRTGYNRGFLYSAKPFGCRTKVRSDRVRETVEREFGIAQRDVFSRFQEG